MHSLEIGKRLVNGRMIQMADLVKQCSTCPYIRREDGQGPYVLKLEDRWEMAIFPDGLYLSRVKTPSKLSPTSGGMHYGEYEFEIAMGPQEQDRPSVSFADGANHIPLSEINTSPKIGPKEILMLTKYKGMIDSLIKDWQKILDMYDD